MYFSYSFVFKNLGVVHIFKEDYQRRSSNLHKNKKLKPSGNLDLNPVLSPVNNFFRYYDKRLQNMVVTELRNYQANYMNRKRAYGEGEIITGKSLYLSEDIYSLGFMSQLRDDVKTKYLDIKTVNYYKL